MKLKILRLKLKLLRLLKLKNNNTATDDQLRITIMERIRPSCNT